MICRHLWLICIIIVVVVVAGFTTINVFLEVKPIYGIPVFLAWIAFILYISIANYDFITEELAGSDISTIESIKNILISIMVALYFPSLINPYILIGYLTILIVAYSIILIKARNYLNKYVYSIWFMDSEKINNYMSKFYDKPIPYTVIELIKNTSNVYTEVNFHDFLRSINILHYILSASTFRTLFTISIGYAIAAYTIYLIIPQFFPLTSMIFILLILASMVYAYHKGTRFIAKFLEKHSFYESMIMLSLIDKNYLESKELKLPVTYFVHREELERGVDSVYELLLNAAMPLYIVNTIVLILSESLLKNEGFKEKLYKVLTLLPSNTTVILIKVCSTRECERDIMHSLIRISRRKLRRGNWTGPVLLETTVIRDYSFIILALSKSLQDINRRLLKANIIMDLGNGNDPITDICFALTLSYILRKYKGIVLDLGKVIGVIPRENDKSLSYLATQAIFMDKPYRKYILKDIIKLLEYADKNIEFIVKPWELLIVSDESSVSGSRQLSTVYKP